MPLLTLIIVATIEAASLLYLQQSLSIACYEGARVALVPEATSANAKYQAELILASRGVNAYEVTVSPTDLDSAPEGSWIRIQASAPFGQNSLVGGWLFNNRSCSADAEMIKER